MIVLMRFVRAEHRVHEERERCELGVVDLDEHRAVLGDERPERLEARAHHRVPLRRRARVGVLGERAAGVVRRVEVGAPDRAGEACLEPPQRIEVVPVDEQVVGARIAMGAQDREHLARGSSCPERSP